MFTFVVQLTYFLKHLIYQEDTKYLKRVPMAEWLERVFQGHEMHCHDLEVMSSNLGQVKLGVRTNTSV